MTAWCATTATRLRGPNTLLGVLLAVRLIGCSSGEPAGSRVPGDTGTVSDLGPEIDASPGIDSSAAADSSLTPDGDADDTDTASVDGTPAETGDAGTGSDGGCPSGQKFCAGSCVTVGPENGCGASSCEPCMLPLAIAECQAGACNIAMCTDSHFNDYNNIDADGCEATCFPGDDSALCKISGGTGTASCTVKYLCACEGAECRWGERCKSTGSTFVCSCNGGAACSAGQKCCPTGGCVDQTSDAMNCGGCGLKCGTGKSCIAGVCV